MNGNQGELFPLEFEVFKEPVDYQTVEVNIRLDGVVSHNYYTQLYANMQDCLPHGQTMRFTEEEFVWYMRTLIYNRVLWCRKEAGRKPIFRATDRILIPSGLGLFINSIGLVEDASQGVTMKPQIVEFEPMSYDQVVQVSQWLKQFERHGFTFQQGFDKVVYGNFDFMSFVVIRDDIVCRDDQKAPCYALMCAFLETQVLESVFSYRVRYGKLDYFKTIIRELAEPRSRS